MMLCNCGDPIEDCNCDDNDFPPVEPSFCIVRRASRGEHFADQIIHPGLSAGEAKKQLKFYGTSDYRIVQEKGIL
jgi:hypothetical protein